MVDLTRKITRSTHIFILLGSPTAHAMVVPALWLKPRIKCKSRMDLGTQLDTIKTFDAATQQGRTLFLNRHAKPFNQI